MAPDVGSIIVDFMPVHLEPHLAKHGIEATVLVQCTDTEAETHFILDVAKSTQFVAAVVGWTDLLQPDAPARISSLARSQKLVGLRPMVQWLPDGWLLQPALAPAIACMIELGLTFDALVYPHQLSDLRRFLDRYPDLCTVIDHGGKPQIREKKFEPWASEIGSIAKETDAFCKLSGLITEAGPHWDVEQLRPYVEHLVDRFGPARLMWGSDWPVSVLAGGYDPWARATDTLLVELPPGDRAEIEGNTARRFYHLEGPSQVDQI
ncbi:amidohydrolase family protein [Bradyrhizobium sp. CB3481]|uniref:amidohydrolase family protein n=1 Tax=Bradyrhizobium sp. CB3481 TaxID=3039158 RepID=UPI0024B13A6E|nr:amidohydrolase family protein [Bradyrhizobium sp. CB3481]WFU14591.1 amidohydrolase family protein [Bradyrhizobium sp. CB3481]